MDDFTYDVIQRKRLANQARHRKNGSKSRKCPMSTDYMTKRQWEKKCGEVMTYQLGKPMLWDEFQALPKNIQKEYLLGMIEKYQATASDLAKMFGISSPTVTKFCKRPEIDIAFSAGKRMPKEKREEFQVMLSGNEDQSGDEEQDEKVDDPQRYVGPIETMVHRMEDSERSEMAMTGFTLCFDGKFNHDMILNSVLSMLPAGTNVKMEIKCEITG